MESKTDLPEFLDIALQTSRFGVLATEGKGQPHISLIAITPVKEFSQLVFATYRNTRKFRNLIINGKVAVLLSGGDSDIPGLQNGSVVTAFGNAEEIGITTYHAAMQAHLNRHPELMTFLGSPDCVHFLIHVEKYQIVQGIEQVTWLSVEDLDGFVKK
ncbi:MAG: pyridoxamine 5'-phosphate oxidase family protein [Bacteroidales bacterium]|nr:pyridoxamine 5'-phosphate oxidase family protein [Bacteroidales bacterium]